MLQGEDARQAEELQQRLQQDWEAGHFEEALRRAEALWALRRKAQGADHWQTAIADWQAEALRRILKRDAGVRKKMAAFPALDRRAEDQRARGHYRAAQPLFEKQLTILRKALGDDHPYTATAAAKLANNLDAQGSYADAQPLLEQALAIHRKALGEDHPDTARSYTSVAFNLHARGRYAAAQPLLEKALTILQKAFGEDHPDTALSYNNLAYCLQAQGRYAAAQPLFEKTLAVLQKALGEDHRDTAVAYSNLAANLNAQGRYAAAQPLYEKALAIWRKALGEDHPDTARAYNNLAYNLDAQGKYTASQPLFEKALAIWRKALGEDHPDTATAYHNLAMNLQGQGRYAAAQPLFERALAITRKALGEDHPGMARACSGVAANLHAQGRYAAAQPLYEKALVILRKLQGEDHPDTARAYNNVAYNLNAQGRYAAAEPLFENALAMRRKLLGEDHPDTARSYNNLAYNLNAQGRYADAQPHNEKALAIRRSLLGEDHPDTAQSYNNLAANLNAQGRYTVAESLHGRALAISRKALGEDHPDTALMYNWLAWNLSCQGRYAEAESYWAKGAGVLRRARAFVATGGLERGALTGERSRLPNLAAILARNGKPGEAWRRYEESLARGTWEDLSARLRRSPEDRDRQTALVQEIHRLDHLIERTFARKGTPGLKARREELLTRRRQKADELTALTDQLEKQYGPAAGELYGRVVIQEALPRDAALVGWVDIPGQPKAADPDGEHWAVVLRARGTPVWQRLRGKGAGGAWTEADTRLPAELRRALLDSSPDWHRLAARLHAQRLQPLADHLAAHDGLPAARRLIVLPSAAVAGVPLEVCADGSTVSYAPSGTLFAFLHRQHNADARGLLAVADPVFETGRPNLGPAPLPPGGLLLTMVLPGSNAARARLRADDVLLRYAGIELKSLPDLGRLLQEHAQDKEVRVTVWRDGRTAERSLAGGKLGAMLAQKPAPEALAERRQADRLLASSRSTDDGQWPALPGTRVEAEGLGQLCEAAGLPFRLLAGSRASEQELDRLAGTKELAGYRYIHLATHGTLDERLPLQSAVILSRDRLPDPLKQLEADQPVYDGRLTAEKVLERWDLHADLVTLSACQTALGKYESGEGFVGFTQALLLSGARSVCLSLWKVDDTATALLIHRFYANLLGQRPGLKKPLGKAEALAEAKHWLRELTADEAVRQAGVLSGAEVRGTVAKRKPLVVRAATGGRPYAHPYYWAAFVLVGDGR